MFQKYIMSGFHKNLDNILFQESIDDEIVMVKRQLIANPNNMNTIMRLMTLSDRSGNKELGEEALKLGQALADRLDIISIEDIIERNFPLAIVPDTLRWNFYRIIGEMFDNELGESVVSVEYSEDPGEPQTRDEPGSPGGIEVDDAEFDYKPAHLWFGEAYEKIRNYIDRNLPVPFPAEFTTSKRTHDGTITFTFSGYAEIIKIGPVEQHGGQYAMATWRFPSENAVNIEAGFEHEIS